MQEQKDIDPNLLYNLLCIIKPLVEYGFYTPWNEEGKPDVRKHREANNNKMTKHLVEFCRYGGMLTRLKIILLTANNINILFMHYTIFVYNLQF